MQKRYKKHLPRNNRGSKKDKGTFLENQAEELCVITGQTLKMYYLLRSLDKKSKSLLGTIFSKKANPITATAETLDRWAEHFEELLIYAPVESVQPRHSAEQPLATVRTTPPTFVRMKEAVHRLRNHNAAGTDKILPELYTHVGQSLTTALTQIMDMIWNQRAIQSEWKTAGSQKCVSKKCENYRESHSWTLLSYSAKVSSPPASVEQMRNML